MAAAPEIGPEKSPLKTIASLAVPAVDGQTFPPTGFSGSPESKWHAFLVTISLDGTVAIGYRNGRRRKP
jgi:hypothetical protein